jgi:hypothetical protein
MFDVDNNPSAIALCVKVSKIAAMMRLRSKYTPMMMKLVKYNAGTTMR